MSKEELDFDKEMQQVTMLLTGQMFGRLLVIGFDRAVIGKKNAVYWNCLCECGNVRSIAGHSLRYGRTKSCGCLRAETTRERSKSHGQSATPEYKSYSSAKSRCNNPKDRKYSIYGGRGIEFRFSTFSEFHSEVGDRPTRAHSLDRIDTNGHYEPGNVRWATARQQANNKRVAASLTINGETQTIAEWARQTGVHPSRVYWRHLQGWSDKEALMRPPVSGLTYDKRGDK